MLYNSLIWWEIGNLNKMVPSRPEPVVFRNCMNRLIRRLFTSTIRNSTTPYLLFQKKKHRTNIKAWLICFSLLWMCLWSHSRIMHRFLTNNGVLTIFKLYHGLNYIRMLVFSLCEGYSFSKWICNIWNRISRKCTSRITWNTEPNSLRHIHAKILQRIFSPAYPAVETQNSRLRGVRHSVSLQRYISCWPLQPNDIFLS